MEFVRKRGWVGIATVGLTASASIAILLWWLFRDDEDTKDGKKRNGQPLPQYQTNSIVVCESPVLREATTPEQIAKRHALENDPMEANAEEIDMDAVGVCSDSMMLPPSIRSDPCVPLDTFPSTPLSDWCSTVPSPVMSDSSWEDIGAARSTGRPVASLLENIPERSRDAN